MPYAVDREIEDIEALIDHAGGPAFLYGHSSGGTLAMQAAVRLGGRVSKIAIYEPPHNDDPDAQESWSEYLRGAGTGPGRRAPGRRSGPEAIAPTLAYDHAAIIGEPRTATKAAVGEAPETVRAAALSHL